MSETTVCGYCGYEAAEPTGLHAQLYGVLHELVHNHNGTWENLHAYAARVEALVNGKVDPWHDMTWGEDGECACETCRAAPQLRVKVVS